MTRKHATQRYRRWYAILLRLYPKPFRARFGESMEQTFNDLLHERQEAHERLFAFVLWTLADTLLGIARERVTMHSKNLTRIALGTVLILLLPLVAMQFSDNVNWSLFDFVVAGVLLFGTGAAFELVAKQVRSTPYQLAVGAALATALILIWINLAVGLIGSENEPANLMYFGVLGVAFAGAVAARFRPRGMARALYAAAFVQALIGIIALLAGMHDYPGSSVLEIVNITLFFVALWVGSAVLFQRASATNASLQH